MSAKGKSLFADILAESKDGEWGKSEAEFGLEQVLIIRGTDFKKLSNPNADFPLRWVKSDLVKRKRLVAGDLILETAGGTSNESTGRSALLKDTFFQSHSNVPILCASFSRFLRLKTNEYYPAYIYYLLQSLHKSGYMAVFNIQHTGVSRFQFTSFKNKTRLDIPEFSEQQKIAAILSAYDDLIENNNKRIALLEKAAEEIYREWFVRMRFPGWEKVKFVKGIPADWEVIKVADAFEFLGGGTPSTTEKRYWDDGTVNWFTPSDITKANGIFLPESIDKCTDEGLNNSSARMFPAYSVMMTSRATIGAVGVNTAPASTNQGFITCIPNENYPLTFLYHWLKLNKPYFEMLATGSTFAELTKGTFKKIKILKPKKELVEQYELKVLPMFKEMEFLLEKVVLLKKSRDLLRARLISGKLPVEDLDIRFPPSMVEEVTAEA
jgi:type I restriction enzyme, S subunit